MSEQEVQQRARIGARIREARKISGLSQGQVAHMLNLHRPAVSEIEAGNRRVSADELARMAEIFDVGIGWLLGVSPEALSVDDPKLQLAARELSKLKTEDLDRVLRLLAAMREPRTANENGDPS